jgi:hypothetical protein
MAIDKSGADTYFGSGVHIMNAIWIGFSDALRTAAVAHAKMLMALWIDDDLDTDTTTDADFPRHDCACYEQALWMLKKSNAVPNGEQTGPKFVAADGDSKPAPEANGFSLAPEAARFLAKNPRAIRLCRG